MTDKKALRVGDRAALVDAASGRCYNPECDQPLIERRGGMPVVNYEFAHIRDELPPSDRNADVGWRYWPDEDLSQDQRNAVENLLLLCPPCHKLIDRIDPRSYGVELLHEWKRSAERGSGSSTLGSLAGLIRDRDEFDALTLGVHQAVAVVDGSASEVSPLPPYLYRPHDNELRKELVGLANRSCMIAVIGGPSTGKTRACWEAVRETLPDWRLWHPLTPAPPEAVLDALEQRQVEPNTVIWLNEAQVYLAPPEIGERVATALHELLHDPGLRPLLVLATIGKSHFSTLCTANHHPAAQQLFRTSRTINVPPDFSTRELEEQGERIAADPRLRLAVATPGRRVVQFLSGALELEARYRGANDATRAVLWAAMDACRLGHSVYLQQDLLRDAAPSYLDRDTWEQCDDTWFSQAVEYLSTPCLGVPGPLALRRPYPGESPTVSTEYRLAGYLDHLGRHERRGHFPPEGFWTAALDQVDRNADRIAMAQAAYRRGRRRLATDLYQRADAAGSVEALTDLARMRSLAGDYVGAYEIGVRALERGSTKALHVAGRVAEGSIFGSDLEEIVQKARDHDHEDRQTGKFSAHFYDGDRDAARMLHEAAARHGDVESMCSLAQLLSLDGLHDQAQMWYEKAVDRRSGTAMRALGRICEDRHDSTNAARYYRMAIDHGDKPAFKDLAKLYAQIGDHIQALEVARAAAADGNVMPLHELAGVHVRAGDLHTARLCCQEALEYAATDNLKTFVTHALASLAALDNDYDRVVAVYKPLVDEGNGYARYWLFQHHIEMNDLKAATDLAEEAAAAGDFGLYVDLAQELRDEDEQGSLALIEQAAAQRSHTALFNLAVRHAQAGDHTKARDFAVQAAIQCPADNTGKDAIERLAQLRHEAHDDERAGQLLRLAGDYGNPGAVLNLARLRFNQGDPAGAEAVALEAVNQGHPGALELLADMVAKTATGARGIQLSRYGLNADGSIADPW